MIAATLFIVLAAVQLPAAMLTMPSTSTVVRLGEIAYCMHPLPHVGQCRCRLGLT